MSEDSQRMSWQEIAAEAGREREPKRRAELWLELEKVLDERREIPPRKVPSVEPALPKNKVVRS